MINPALPTLVRLVHDRFIYRLRKVPFNKNLFVLSYNQKTALVSARETGQTWVVRWKDLKVTQFD